jgi:uncharacterized protein YpuA (DUF1002 family)
MDKNLRDEMDANIEQGKAETERIRDDVHTQAEAAKAELDAKADQAEGDVREHFEQVRGEAADELNTADAEANQLGSAVERNRENAEDHLVQMLDKARERENAHEAKGFFDKIKDMFTGGRN